MSASFHTNKKAIRLSIAIFLGLILATVIMCLISYGGIQAIIDMLHAL